MAENGPALPAGSTGIALPGAALPDTSTMAPEAVRAALDTIRQNPLSDFAKALTDRSHPEHAAIRRWNDAAYARAYPEEGLPAETLAKNPGMEMTEAERETFDAAVPARPEDYRFDVPPGMGHLPRNAEFENETKALFHAAGLTNNEAGIVASRYFATLRDAGSRLDQAKAERVLRSMWGAEYDRNVAAARALLKGAKVGGHIIEVLEETGLGNDVTFIRTLAEAGRRKGY